MRAVLIASTPLYESEDANCAAGRGTIVATVSRQSAPAAVVPYSSSVLLFQRLDLMTQLADDLLQILDRRQLLTDRCRQLPGDPVGGDTDRLLDVLEGILHH